MRNFYTAAYLMKKSLRNAGSSNDVQKATEWFFGADEINT
jgi:hypothetical protein